MRDFQRPGRSPVYAGDAMVATSHPLATAAALDALRAGGNAVDAAIAAIAVQCVVEPHMTGVGGDCFMLLSDSAGTLSGLNSSGTAAAAASTASFLEQGIDAIAADSVHSITIPGAVRGWETALQRHGTFGLDRALQPAIGYAMNSYPVAPRVSADWAELESAIGRDEGMARHYLVDGRAPVSGTRHANPALGRTLTAIAENGADAFYTGPIAEDMVNTIQAKGGLLSLDDFAEYRPLDAVPIRTTYRGLEIAELPPNGQGLTALIMLNLLEQLGLSDLPSDGAERLHLEMEAGRLAYSCRDTAVADPESMVHDTAQLVGKDFAATLKAGIDRDQRNNDLELPPLPGSDTVYVTVVDRDRNACSFINSLFGGFGSLIATLETGVVFQNRGAGFVVQDGHPNTIEGGKRPMHTIIPAMALKDGRPIVSFGVMGGAYQPVGHAHVVTNMVDYGMDVQEAIDAPRIFWNSSGVLQAETTLSPQTLAGLAAKGHEVQAADAPIGGAQAICIDWENGVLIGGSDPRKDGSALGF
ncbi:MAG: gamma-glutamyltransferase [Pseudomonadota bacterium]